MTSHIEKANLKPRGRGRGPKDEGALSEARTSNTPAWEPIVQVPKTLEPKGRELKRRQSEDRDEQSLKRKDTFVSSGFPKRKEGCKAES